MFIIIIIKYNTTDVNIWEVSNITVETGVQLTPDSDW